MKALPIFILLSCAIFSCAKFGLMKKISAIAAFQSVFLNFNQPVLASSIVEGEKLFEKNCAFCHAGGNNVLPFARDKTLYMDALKKYGYDSKINLNKVISTGAGAMPGFGKVDASKPARLQSEEIDSIASYVITRASQQWKP